MNNARSSTARATGARYISKQLRVFFDADVLIRAAYPQSRQSASYILLQLSELTLIEGVCSPYVIKQAERNIDEKLPEILAEFKELIEAAIDEVQNAPEESLGRFSSRAHPEDLPVLAAAVLNSCRYLVTVNVRHYPKPPRGLKVVTPGRFVEIAREKLTGLEKSALAPA